MGCISNLLVFALEITRTCVGTHIIHTDMHAHIYAKSFFFFFYVEVMKQNPVLHVILD